MDRSTSPDKPHVFNSQHWPEAIQQSGIMSRSKLSAINCMDADSKDKDVGYGKMPPQIRALSHQT